MELFNGYTGADLYGLKTDKSDTDKIKIYLPTQEQMIDNIFTNKNLRYYSNVVEKDIYNKNTSNSVDILNIDIFTFVNEFFSGSPNAFEVVYSNTSSSDKTYLFNFVLVRDILLESIEENKDNCLFYMKSFLKMMNKYKKRFLSSKNGKDLYHVLRMYITIEYFINNGNINFRKMYNVESDYLKELKQRKNIPIDEYEIMLSKYRHLENYFESINNTKQISSEKILKYKESIKYIFLGGANCIIP